MSIRGIAIGFIDLTSVFLESVTQGIHHRFEHDEHRIACIVHKALSSYFTAALITPSRGTTPELNLRFERTSPLAIDRRLDCETGDSLPLSSDDAHSEKDY